MPIDKIAIVIVFLVALILLQLVIKYRGKISQSSFPTTQNLNVYSRLSLSKTERADLISVGPQSFMVIFSKGSAPTVIELAPSNTMDEELALE